MNEEKLNRIKEFLKFCREKLELKNKIKLTLTDDRKKYGIPTFAYFNPNTNELFVYIKNRNLADSLRSIAHELVHARQGEKGELTKPIQDIGGPEENEANAVAGALVKEFGYSHEAIYESKMIKFKNLL